MRSKCKRYHTASRARDIMEKGQQEPEARGGAPRGSSALRALSPAEEQAIDAAADVTEVAFIAGRQFRDGAAMVAYLGERLPNGGPIDVAFAEIDPGVTVLAALEVLQMDLGDAGSEGADPVLWIAVEHHIAHVKPGPDERMFELGDVAGHLEWALKEFVPDFLDGNNDVQLFGEREKGANLRLRAGPGVL